MAEYREFAARLSYIMTLKGLRNKDIVAEYKKRGQIISASAVSQLLAGRFAPTRQRIELLSEILEVDEVWLQGYGDVEDVQKLDDKELKKSLRRMRKIFTSLRPELQRTSVQFMEFMEFVNQSDVFLFQQQMSRTKKVKNEWKDVLDPVISVPDVKSR